MTGYFSDFYGNSPFGVTDWAKIVLWDELPDYIKTEDLENGGWFKLFVESLMPSMNWIRRMIYNSHDHLIDPSLIRKDMLQYLAKQFGIVPDLAEPESFQRTKIEMVGRWRLWKGNTDSYKILCAIHGFSVTVKPVYFDGVKYTTTPPLVYNEIIGIT